MVLVWIIVIISSVGPVGMRSPQETNRTKAVPPPLVEYVLVAVYFRMTHVKLVSYMVLVRSVSLRDVQLHKLVKVAVRGVDRRRIAPRSLIHHSGYSPFAVSSPSLIHILFTIVVYINVVVIMNIQQTHQMCLLSKLQGKDGCCPKSSQSALYQTEAGKTWRGVGMVAAVGCWTTLRNHWESLLAVKLKVSAAKLWICLNI